MIHVSAVPYEYVEAVWPHVKGFLAKAVKLQEGVHNIDSIKSDLDNGTLALWVMIDDEAGKPVAASTTRIVQYPERRAMVIDWVGGKRMNEWLPALAETMDKYAIDCGCKHIEGAGRAGWVKALAPHGYEPGKPTYRKEL